MSTSHAATNPPIESHSINANGIELHYLEAGKGGETPVVLLHGYAESSHMWPPLIKALDDRRVVLAPDLPGPRVNRRCRKPAMTRKPWRRTSMRWFGNSATAR
ncbi:alpha/beta fold hydrolase [Paraburkholderia sp. BL10I2N1]|uniref:alpha/beta fold hydrolase n=1 Tax=Paraburkholderia sp. BL10I2N1 TaxID=1938796 RepID=UPI001FB815AC|nr:alpha/beta fold hydrolase [Paraburkholderia sp. BL10I2N1]